MRNLRNLRGIIPALSTVMHEDGSIDEEGIRSLVRFNIEKGVHGFAVTIIAGEFYKLSDEERRRVFDLVIDEVNGKVPVFAGTSHTGTEPAIELSRYAEDAGADGVIVMPPFFVKRESELYLHEHFSRVANAVDLPVMIQDAEEFTGVTISSTLCSTLAAEHSNVFIIKVEGPRTLEKISEIRKLMGDGMVILGGMAARFLLEELEAGSQGSIPAGCLPELLVGVYNSHQSGDISGAKKTFALYKRWVDYLSLYPLLGIGLEKETERLRGIIKSSYTRGPKLDLQTNHTEALKKILAGIGMMAGS
ncbi:MAG: dihydrodipicolinate synthase family protein [Thaumarchaeota archaeon]|nr:MAG: dihydrodipicolinate synthase family protein [Nitrososphaerota archaeon]